MAPVASTAPGRVTQVHEFACRFRVDGRPGTGSSPDGSGTVRAARLLMATRALPLPAASAPALSVRLPRLADLDLLVDLGDAIGSPRWWQGLVTLSVLSATAISLGLRMPPIPVPAEVAPGAPEERKADRIGALAAGSPAGARVPATAAVVRLSEVPERPRIELVARVGDGGSLEAALRRAGVGREDLDRIASLAPARLKPGTELFLVLGRRETRSVPRPVESLAFRAAFDLRMEFARESGALVGRRIPVAVDDTPLRVQGEVGRSLYRALKAAGIPGGVINDFIRQMGHVVDIQREIRGRDRFDLVVEHRRAETGEVEFGRLLYAGIRDGRRSIALLRFGPKGEFYRESGESARKGLIRTPVDGARLSSGFGMRFHPVLGYSRMHQGLDFAAPTGTPVVASASGTVVQAGWGGGYGNLVVLRHQGGMLTRYAHLSRIAVKTGQSVAQGQRIGAVGSTGLSTGPHLHYEVWVAGKPVNPKDARYLSGNQLGGAELARFRAEFSRMQGLAVSPR